MPLNPVPLGLRFLLELTALVSAGVLGRRLTGGRDGGCWWYCSP
ncbi:hypothetical protein [Nocardia sp. NPDC002869]